jgi:hypothetical protein
MSAQRMAFAGFIAGVSLAFPISGPIAAEGWEGHLNGAWTLPDNVQRHFCRRGGHWAFQNMFGPSFIVEGREVRGPEARCRIMRAAEHDSKISLVVSCSNSVSFTQSVVELVVKNDNEVERHFPGSDELTITFKKCPR